MSCIAFKWNIIGERLGIQYTHLASLQRQTSGDVDKLAEVLQLWMDTMSKPVTWNTILQTIESPPIESKFTVKKMEEFLKCECLYNPSEFGICIFVNFYICVCVLKSIIAFCMRKNNLMR